MHLFRLFETLLPKQHRRQTRDTYRLSAAPYDKQALQDSIAFNLRMTTVGAERTSGRLRCRLPSYRTVARAVLCMFTFTPPSETESCADSRSTLPRASNRAAQLGDARVQNLKHPVAQIAQLYKISF
jgi:hypothetical protein